jgi:hypothetical protein
VVGFLAVAAVVVLGAAGAVFFATLSFSSRRMLNAIEHGRFTFEPTSEPLSDDLAARLADAEWAGFELVDDAVLALPDDRQRLVLLGRADGAMIELSQRADGDGRAKSAVLSPLAPGDGLLATQEVYGLLTAPTELKQVFADAPVRQLVVEHDRALRWLASQGLRARAHPLDQTRDRYVRWVRRSGAEHSRSLLLFLRLARAETQERVFADAGPITESASTAAKIAAIKAGPDDLWT